MAEATHKQRMSELGWRRELVGLLFTSPWILGFLLFTLYPLASSLYYSFTRYDLMQPPVFIGLLNYTRLPHDSDFINVLKQTLWWVGFSAPAGVISAFAMATLLNTPIWGRSVFRAIFFFPSIVPEFVVAIVWQFLLNINYGAINSTLRALGFESIPFLSNPAYAKPSLLLIHMWAQGSAMVIFLATLQDVPRSLYEAATVDGAGAFRRWWNITIPLCSPVIFFNLVMAFIGGWQTFTLPWLLTQGGPNQSTEFYAINLYRNAFSYMRMGKACALAWVLFLIVVLFTVILFRVTGRWVYYEGD
ncbi:MAG: sugar ABC transporter permease [Anaerolineales bacterium]